MTDFKPLDEAYYIVNTMGVDNHKSPTSEQRAAKQKIFEVVILKKCEAENREPSPLEEPDFNEGWS